ncbi:hypothetical protein [Bacillus sp. CBEL-1]|uniref:hypothetical protein n=1 Tax=Bacillus sp. CBEL-1 TaxID=2502980 RepID=UPI001051A3F6|nr:hypothetical protein [Bacillus sp. CBEL-1]TDB49496.1 hypothetical protein EPL02_10225 [Bacillus sp. CBEL-1]
MKIRTMFSVASLCILLILGACSVATNNLETEMEVHSEINSLSDEKFSHIGTTGLNDASKEDFRKFSFTFLLEGPEKAAFKSVEVNAKWKTINKEEKEKTINLEDILKFR